MQASFTKRKKNKTGGGGASLHGEKQQVVRWFCRAVVESRADSVGLCLSVAGTQMCQHTWRCASFRGRHTHAGVWGRWAGGLLKDPIALSAVLEWQARGREVVSKPPRATRGLSAQQEREAQTGRFWMIKGNLIPKLGHTMVQMCQAVYIPFKSTILPHSRHNSLNVTQEDLLLKPDLKLLVCTK